MRIVTCAYRYSGTLGTENGNRIRREKSPRPHGEGSSTQAEREGFEPRTLDDALAIVADRTAYVATRPHTDPPCPDVRRTGIAPTSGSWRKRGDLNQKGSTPHPTTMETTPATTEPCAKAHDRNSACSHMQFLAEREGFEPSRRFNTPYSLSRRAPSAARPPLQVDGRISGHGALSPSITKQEQAVPSADTIGSDPDAREREDRSWGTRRHRGHGQACS